MHVTMYYRFQKQGCPEYRDLYYIFRDTTTTGENARPSARSFSGDSLDKQKEDIDANVVDMQNHGNTNEEVNEKYNSNNNKAKKAKIESSNSVEQSLAVVAENSKRKADMLEQKLATLSGLAAAKSEALFKKSDTQNLLECMMIMQTLDIGGVEFTK
ncbi:hypothetical protein LINGRAHAP2_LOCUS23309 [Linum grandiflorum]